MNPYFARQVRAGAMLTAILLAAALGACRDGDPPAVEPDPNATIAPGESTPSDSPVDIMPTVQPTSEAAGRATRQAVETLPRPARSIGSSGITDGELQLPFCVAVDDTGTIYVGDSTGLQAFDPSGTFLRRFGAGELTGVEGVAVRPDASRIYAAHQTGEVVVFGADGERLGTVGPPPARAAEAWSPVGLALDSTGRLFVGDSTAGTVEVFDASGAFVRTITSRSDQRFSSPRALAVDVQDRLYVGLGDDFLIQRFMPDGTYVDSFGHSYSDESMFRVGGVAVDEEGKVYATRAVNQYIQVFDASADPPVWIGDFGGPGRGSGGLSTPTGIAVLGDELFVADQNNHRIQVFTLP